MNQSGLGQTRAHREKSRADNIQLLSYTSSIRTFYQDYCNNYAESKNHKQKPLRAAGSVTLNVLSIIKVTAFAAKDPSCAQCTQGMFWGVRVLSLTTAAWLRGSDEQCIMWVYVLTDTDAYEMHCDNQTTLQYYCLSIELTRLLLGNNSPLNDYL